MTAPDAGRRARAWAARGVLAVTTAALVGTSGLAPATAATAYPSDTAPSLIPALKGYDKLWKSHGPQANDLHGTVRDRSTLQWNDRVDSWINQHATTAQQFRALQDSQYQSAAGAGYDQSFTIADGLGANLGRYYVRGRLDGQLPLTSALINSSNGTTGAYESTGSAKARFSYPRPYLPASAKGPSISADCPAGTVNASSLTKIRRGKAWADQKGRLKITKVAARVDRTHRFSDSDVTLDVGYGDKGLCTGGSFPSGHTTTAYEAGITLATLLPEVAPEVLTRASEAGNNRIVLGVHYPLDIVGGRMDGEIALAARWTDPEFRTRVLAPARRELVGYLEKSCGATLAVCVARDTPYRNAPYRAGAEVPRGSAQRVTDRRSAVRVYTERMSYGFRPTSSTHRAASVPAGAGNLLRTAFPTLTNRQRRSVLAQTEIASGHPLDTTAAAQRGRAPGSWQRLNLAAATSATVVVRPDRSVVVVATGSRATVRVAR